MAKIKISELSSASAVSSTDIIVVNQSSTTKKATVALLLTDYATSAALTTGLATKEDSFSKNTAFNKNFGTGTTNVVEIGTTLGNSQVVETNALGKLITAAKATGYNLALGTTAGTVLEGSNDDLYAKLAGTQTFTGVNTFAYALSTTASVRFQNTRASSPSNTSEVSLFVKNAAETITSAAGLSARFTTLTAGSEVGEIRLQTRGGGAFATRFSVDNSAATFTVPITASSDSDSTHTFGRAKIGSPTTDNAFFAHFDHLSTTNYALKQDATGNTIINAASGAVVDFRINNASIFSYTSAALTFGDGKNLSFSSGATGSKIGVSSSQKIAFWGASATTQPTAVADASGGATIDSEARTALNDLLSKLRTIGIIAT